MIHPHPGLDLDVLFDDMDLELPREEGGDGHMALCSVTRLHVRICPVQYNFSGLYFYKYFSCEVEIGWLF